MATIILKILQEINRHRELIYEATPCPTLCGWEQSAVFLNNPMNGTNEYGYLVAAQFGSQFFENT